MNEDSVSKPQATLPKEMRITSQKELDALFSSGNSFVSYPLRVVYLQKPKNCRCDLAMLVSVPKKRLKRANKRNRMKRLIRETFRTQRHQLSNSLAPLPFSMNIAFLYLKSELAPHSEVLRAMQKALTTLQSLLISPSNPSENDK